VDLIPVLPRGKPVEKRWKDLRLSRRDFLMFGIGAGTVLFAMAVGKILAWIAPLKKASPQPAEDSESPTEK
jgi:hypothetical protein